MADEICNLILKCGSYFVKLEKEIDSYVAGGIFTLGRKTKSGARIGRSQEVRFFKDASPLMAMQKLYYEIKNHYGEE